MTDHQFQGFLSIEADHQRNEMAVAASGTFAAIAQAFGGKQSKAMAGFRKSLGGGSSAGDSSEMGKLRDRIRGIRDIVRQGAA